MLASHTMLTAKKIAELAEIGYFNHRWYHNARAELITVAGGENWNWQRFADILALLSPRVSVRRNIRMALQYMGDGTYLGDVVRNIKTAVKTYETTGVIGGYKVPQFAAALKGDENSIVLDSWMAKALFRTTDSNAIKNFRRKATMAEACKRITTAGKLVGLSPRDTQACVWQAIIETHKATPATYSVCQEYELWLSHNRQFPASGPIDASDILAIPAEDF